ncbi:hypothetical protein N8I77_011600 [Diaporthe amygdali]|uniref:RRM domain-containing protein n=1 Tax=Phomopsis amygdali TaxID=1214568 RepID=A0AAD9S731_PHOAM|nr:hypothetical protein N8I77_011600 [Diaporthe amygdali]
MDMPKTSDLLPYEVSGRSAGPIQSRRKIPNKWLQDTQKAEVTRPPLSLKTSPTDVARSPQYEHAHERQPHSAYTYNTFPSISPKFTRDVERRNSTWAVPRQAYVPTSISRDENVRCNILYVSNLPSETSEDELEDIFSKQNGYVRLSVHARANGPSCIVEFDDVTSAAKALRNLYGWPLKNSRMGGIRLSFSKDHLGIQAAQVPAPRTPRRAPPPPPLILPVRSPPHSAGRLAPTAIATRVAEPEPPRPSIEIESASSPRIEESVPRLLEDKAAKESPPAKAATELRSQHLADQDRAFDDLAMYTVKGPDYKIETFDEWRLWLERAVEMELDWYPLPPIKQPVRLSECQLVWSYNGQSMSIYLDEDETERCGMYLEDFRGRPLISKPDVQSERPAITNARRATSIALAWSRIMASSWLGPQSGSSGRTHNASHGSVTAQRLESHFCIENHPSLTQQTTLLTLGCLEHMQDDFDFFVQARRMLGGAEGSWIRQMLPWSYHQVKLSRFRFPSNGSDQVEATDVTGPLDPRDILGGYWGGYEFKFSGDADINIHMRVYASILLEGLRYPEIGRGSRTLLDGIPKLRKPIAFEKETMIYGWGFYVRQSLSIPKILAWAVTIMVLGFTFLPFFAPLSFSAAVFILFILRLGSHTELRL